MERARERLRKFYNDYPSKPQFVCPFEDVDEELFDWVLPMVDEESCVCGKLLEYNKRGCPCYLFGNEEAYNRLQDFVNRKEKE